MKTFNLFAGDDWDRENDRPGYRHRVTVFGQRLGASLLGGSLYDVPPGEKTWPYHYEQGCEEWLLVVAGRPTLRSPDGEQELQPGDAAVFPEGPAGAHQVWNATEEPVRWSSSPPSRRWPSSTIPTAGRSVSGRRARATRRCCVTSRSSTTGTARSSGRSVMW